MLNNTGMNPSYNHHKFKSNDNLNGNKDFDINDEYLELNRNANFNSLEGVSANDNVSKEIINKLLHMTDNTLHRKSESLTNLNDDKFLDKVNKILQNVGNTIGSNSSSRNNLKEFISTDRIKENSNKDFNEDNLNELNQNIINNNFFINVANLNNMELKLDENVMKKLEDVNFSNKIKNINGLKKLNMPAIAFNKISKFYDYTNKFGIIYFVNNTHIGICFNDNSNLLKNVKINNDKPIDYVINNKNLQYLFIDKDGNTFNYDEFGFENYLNSNTQTSGSKDLIKKFEIFKHILVKYTPELDSLANSTFGNKMFYVKKFLKVQHAILFRLSNKLIQVAFVDKTELLMSTESNEFCFRNKNGEEYQDSLQNVMNSDNVELIKRIKYSKNLLIHFVKSQKNKKLPVK